MVTQTKPRALVIGNFRGRAGIIDALRGSPFYVVEATECRRGIKHVLEDAPNVVIISGSTRDTSLLNLLRAIRCLTSVPILVIGSGQETCASEFLFPRRQWLCALLSPLRNDFGLYQHPFKPKLVSPGLFWRWVLPSVGVAHSRFLSCGRPVAGAFLQQQALDNNPWTTSP